jgi:hypothetical protein
MKAPWDWVGQFRFIQTQTDTFTHYRCSKKLKLKFRENRWNTICFVQNVAKNPDDKNFGDCVTSTKIPINENQNFIAALGALPPLLGYPPITMMSYYLHAGCFQGIFHGYR